MARRSTAKRTSARAKTPETHTCNLPPVPEREFPPTVNPFRARLIRVADKKWVNGTVLRYYFFDRRSDGRLVGPEAQRAVVRRAFKAWKDLGIGLEFKEVALREDAEIRIGFDSRDGSWSYVGRDVIDLVPNPDQATMNFGWDLTTTYGWDTALHEIGHTLGFPHEHQNPNAGIVWDRDTVYDHFRGPPNDWDDATIDWNILRKLPPGSVSGSRWDPDSIMHYSFGPGLIDQPARYRNGLQPADGLSPVDIREAKSFYPAIAKRKDPELKVFESRRLKLTPGQQVNFRIAPDYTREYNIQTFGASDSVVVLFERTDGEPRYVDGDDDSGYDRNARVSAKLHRGREYILRVRLYYSDLGGQMAIFMW
jgi:hypothetical protein